MSTESVVVGYWSIRGLGAPLRMMVMYAGVPLQAENYDVTMPAEGGFDLSHWFGTKPALKERNALINLPYIIDGDFVVSQTNACCLYLGRKFGMMGNTTREASEVEQLLCEAYDIRGGVVGFAYSSGGAEKFATYIANVTSTNSSVDKLNLWMSRKVASGGSPEFFVGTSASAADFCIWEILDQIKSMAAFFKAEDPFAKYPFLADFLVRFRALPNNAKYFDSILAGLPANNKQAQSYGGSPSGAICTSSTPTPWHGSSGKY